MKRISLLILCLIASVANAANWYVRPTYAVGSHNGTDWNNAWSDFSINWNSISPGDTIWMSGGTYSQTLTYNKSGTAGNPITVKLATSLDPVPTAAAGWISALSAPAYIVAQNFIALNFQSYVTIDGNVNAGPYGGIIVTIPSPGNDSTCAVTGMSAGFNRSGPSSIGQRVQYVTVTGPGANNTVLPNQANTGSVAFHFCFNGQTYSTNLYIGHCLSDGCNIGVFSQGTVNGMVEYCRFNNVLGCGGCANTSHVHNDLWIPYDAQGFIWRYNIAYNLAEQAFDTGYIGQGEGPFFGVQVYGNIFDAGALTTGAVGNFVTAQPAFTNCYNNTFVNSHWWRQTNPNGAGPNLDFPTTNNLFWNADNQQTGHSDYNFYTASSFLGVPDTHSIVNTANPFVNVTPGVYNTNQDYHLKAGSVPASAGTTLLADGFINKDMDGSTRGGSSGWSIGAYQFGGSGPSTNPVILVTPSSLNFGYLLTNTSATNSFTVQNVGAGTLTGVASVGGGPFTLLTSLGPASYSLTNGQTQTISVKFNPTSVGSFSGTANFTGGGGASASVSGVGMQAFNVGQIFTATNGAISGPFSLTSTGAVFQATEIDSPTTSGQAFYWVQIPTAGNYEVNGYLQAPDSAHNSLYITFDGANNEPLTIWDAPTNAAFAWNLAANRGTGTFDADQFVPMIWNLSAGYHQLIVGGREAGTYLGAWQVISLAAPPPPNGLRIVRVTP